MHTKENYMYVLINNGHSKIDLSETSLLFLIINIPSESMIHVFNQNAKIIQNFESSIWLVQ